MWERDRVHGTDDTLIEYKLGVYVAAPEKTRTDSCVLTLVVDTSGSMSSEVVRTDDGESNTRMEVLKAGLDVLVREYEGGRQIHESGAFLRIMYRIEADIDYIERDFRHTGLRFCLGRTCKTLLCDQQLSPPLPDLGDILHGLDGFIRIAFDRYA